MIYEALGRWATYLATLGVFGVLGLRWLVWRTSRESGISLGRDGLRVLRLLGLAGSAALLAATLLRAAGQSLLAFGPADGLAWDNLRVVAFESRWGGRWIWQPAAALALLVGFLSLGRFRRAGWLIVGAGALGLAVALPMIGHAFGGALTWPCQSVHVLGAGLWIGTLLVASFAPVRPFAADPSMPPATTRRAWFRAFAPLASSSAGAVILSGLVLALSFVPSFSALATSAYGRTLLVKLGLVLAVLALGARNYFALRSRAPEPSAGLPRTVASELAFGLATVVLTGILTSLPQPDAGN